MQRGMSQIGNSSDRRCHSIGTCGFWNTPRYQIITIIVQLNCLGGLPFTICTYCMLFFMLDSRVICTYVGAVQSVAVVPSPCLVYLLHVRQTLTEYRYSRKLPNSATSNSLLVANYLLNHHISNQCIYEHQLHERDLGFPRIPKGHLFVFS